MTSGADAKAFEELLEHLRQARGFDFTAYKRPSLVRRVVNRMREVEAPTFDAYLNYLRVHQEEFEALFNAILINATSFFRDPDVWAYVETTLLPAILAAHQPPEPIRIWSAGCAAGQEAYSIAMLLAERVGPGAVRDRARIYATDVDTEALAEARRAMYPARQMANVPQALVDKYFDRSGEQFTLNRDLRRAVTFGRADLVQDAPISRIDLLMCRNALMYFNADVQARILDRFTFSLDPRGFLVLGRAEMLFSHPASFGVVDLERRVFRVLADPNHRDRMGGLIRKPRSTVAKRAPQNPPLQTAFDADPPVWSGHRALRSELHASRQELDTAYEELQSMNEELQAAVEELETTNEELQAANEELQTMNEEIRSRSNDLSSANAFLESVVQGLQPAVAVIDHEYRVRVWNEAARQLWGLRGDEAVGAHFLSLDIELPVAQIGQPIRDVLRGEEQQRRVTIAAVTRRGQSIQCIIRVMPLRAANASAISGAILVMEEVKPPTDAPAGS